MKPLVDCVQFFNNVILVSQFNTP